MSRIDKEFTQRYKPKMMSEQVKTQKKVRDYMQNMQVSEMKAKTIIDHYGLKGQNQNNKLTILSKNKYNHNSNSPMRGSSGQNSPISLYADFTQSSLNNTNQRSHQELEQDEDIDEQEEGEEQVDKESNESCSSKELLNDMSMIQGKPKNQRSSDSPIELNVKNPKISLLPSIKETLNRDIMNNNYDIDNKIINGSSNKQRQQQQKNNVNLNRLQMIKEKCENMLEDSFHLDKTIFQLENNFSSQIRHIDHIFNHPYQHNFHQ